MGSAVLAESQLFFAQRFAVVLVLFIVLVVAPCASGDRPVGTTTTLKNK
jgi:hypothetical protein